MKRPVLTRRLTLETRQRIADGAGGFLETWASLGHLWADVTARGGKERADAAVPISATRHRIVVRAAPVGALSRPNATQRFREGSRLFAIRAVTELDAQARYLICDCEEEETV